MVMVGSFWPPKHKWREMYLADRVVALAAGANPDLWPAWPEDMAYEKYGCMRVAIPKSRVWLTCQRIKRYRNGC